MLVKQQEGIRWLEFELLQECRRLKHGISLREGGVSQGPFAQLNVGDNVGDTPEAVSENRRRILQRFPGALLVSARQVHGCETQWVSSVAGEKPTCDALLTEESGLALMIQHADCQASIFYDPIHHLLGVVHAGWRGSVQNIYNKVISCLRQKGARPEDLLVCISPSLGPSHAEFIHFRTELPSSFHVFQQEGCLFDFWQISHSQLVQEGVLPSHIEIASICTYENEKEYFSYRREGVTGRHATIAQLL